MPQRTTRRRVADIAYQASSTVRTELPVSGKIRKLYLELTGTLNLSNASGATAVARNPGTVVPNITVYLDREVVLKQGRWNDWRDRSYMHYKLPTEVSDDTSVNATAIASRIEIPFITPYAVRPVDTVLDMDAGQRLDIEVQWGNESSIINGGTKNWTVNPSIAVVAEISRFDPEPIGIYKELAFDSSNLGTAANADLELPLVTGNKKSYHHIFLVSENDPGAAGRGLVATVLNDVRVQQSGSGEVSDAFGRITGSQLQNDFNMYFSKPDAVQVGLYPIPFQAEFDGRNTFNLDTTDLDDLRVIVDHSAYANAGYIRVLNGIIERL